MAMQYDFYSQPLAVAAAMVSRTGMMWFLLTCFAASDKKIRISIIVCAIIQIVVNMVTIMQIIVQCGPSSHIAVSFCSALVYALQHCEVDEIDQR